MAKETLMQYYSRGGYGKGDIPQLLEGSNFINTIGYSLSLCPNINIQNWKTDHYKLAREGSLYYYEGKNLEAIEKIIHQLREECSGAREIFITILPISFYYSESLFTLPLYRFIPNHDEKTEKYMDHTGRVYKDFDDWRANNTLPAVKILYPKNGHLTLKKNSEAKVDCVLEDSAECSRPVKTLLACDIASGTLGLIAGIGATVATGGAALLLYGAVAASATYGAGRTGLKIRDRVKHSETVNPFKSREAFWLWLGFSADLVTFGTLSIASTKFLATFSQSTAIVDITRKFGAATRAMSIFSGSIRPVNDTAKALFTGYEIFTKFRHNNAKVDLKLPKESLMRLSDAMDEFSESNMLMMAVTEGFWSKTKMSYCSREEFMDMVQETIIEHMEESCENKKLFDVTRDLLKDDSSLIEAYKHLDDAYIDLDQMIEVIHDIFTANDDKMEIKLVGGACEMKLNSFRLDIKALGKISHENRMKIVKRLKDLEEEPKNKMMTIQDYSGSNGENFVWMLNRDDALEMIDVWYDIFVICFDEHFPTILDNDNVKIHDHEISLNLLKTFTKEERLNIIFEIKNFNSQQSIKFKKLVSEAGSNASDIYKMLVFDNEVKSNLISSLNATESSSDEGIAGGDKPI